MVKASLNDYRQSPRKIRLVANLIRGKQAQKAITLLTYTIKDASAPLKKLIESALSNAANLNIEKADLYVKSLEINSGTTMKRSMPRARGSAFPIRKHTSHITLTLDVKPAPKGAKAIAKAAKAQRAAAAKAK